MSKWTRGDRPLDDPECRGHLKVRGRCLWQQPPYGPCWMLHARARNQTRTARATMFHKTNCIQNISRQDMSTLIRRPSSGREGRGCVAERPAAARQATGLGGEGAGAWYRFKGHGADALPVGLIRLYRRARAAVPVN
jgi:hypothetical protein